MKKIFALIITVCVISLTSFGQNAKDKIEKQAQDPKTSENAAKADKYIINNKKISDSTVNDKPAVSQKRSSVKHGRKKNGSCNQK